MSDSDRIAAQEKEQSSGLAAIFLFVQLGDTDSAGVAFIAISQGVFREKREQLDAGGEQAQQEEQQYSGKEYQRHANARLAIHFGHKISGRDINCDSC